MSHQGLGSEMCEGDPINPDYYTKGRIESIDCIEAFVFDKPYRWAPLKYLFRAGKKPGQDEVQDLRKAIWWIEREIASIVGAALGEFALPPVKLTAEHMAAIERVAGRNLNSHEDPGDVDQAALEAHVARIADRAPPECPDLDQSELPPQRSGWNIWTTYRKER